MTLTTTTPVQAGRDPKSLVDPEVFAKLAEHFAAVQEVTQTYAERAVGQMLLMVRAHADSKHDPDFGRLLPDGRSYRVVPTKPVDVAWHVSLQHTEPYLAACKQIAGEFVHHIPILTEGMADGTSIVYTARHSRPRTITLTPSSGPARRRAAAHRTLATEGLND